MGDGSDAEGMQDVISSWVFTRMPEVVDYSPEHVVLSWSGGWGVAKQDDADVHFDVKVVAGSPGSRTQTYRFAKTHEERYVVLGLSPEQDYSFTVFPVTLGGDSLCSPFFVETAPSVAPAQPPPKALPDAPLQLTETLSVALAESPEPSSEAPVLWHWVDQQSRPSPEALSGAPARQLEAPPVALAGPPEPPSDAAVLWRWVDQQSNPCLEALSDEPARPPEAPSMPPEVPSVPSEQLLGALAGPRGAPSGEVQARAAPAPAAAGRMAQGELAPEVEQQTAERPPDGPRLAHAETALEAERPAAQLAPEAVTLVQTERALEVEPAPEAEQPAAEPSPLGERALDAEQRAAARPPDAPRLAQAEAAPEAEQPATRRAPEAERPSQTASAAGGERAPEAELRTPPAQAEAAPEAERPAARRAPEAGRAAQAEREAQAERAAQAEPAPEAEPPAAGRPPDGERALEAEQRTAARPPEVQALHVMECHATSIELEWVAPEQEVGCFHVSVYRRHSASQDGAEARRLELVRVELVRCGEPLARQRLVVGGLAPGSSYTLEVVSSKADRTSAAVRADACTCGPPPAPADRGKGNLDEGTLPPGDPRAPWLHRTGPRSISILYAYLGAGSVLVLLHCSNIFMEAGSDGELVALLAVLLPLVPNLAVVLSYLGLHFSRDYEEFSSWLALNKVKALSCMAVSLINTEALQLFGEARQADARGESLERWRRAVSLAGDARAEEAVRPESSVAADDKVCGPVETKAMEWTETGADGGAAPRAAEPALAPEVPTVPRAPTLAARDTPEAWREPPLPQLPLPFYRPLAAPPPESAGSGEQRCTATAAPAPRSQAAAAASVTSAWQPPQPAAAAAAAVAAAAAKGTGAAAPGDAGRRAWQADGAMAAGPESEAQSMRPLVASEEVRLYEQRCRIAVAASALYRDLPQVALTAFLLARDAEDGQELVWRLLNVVLTTLAAWVKVARLWDWLAGGARARPARFVMLGSAAASPWRLASEVGDVTVEAGPSWISLSWRPASCLAALAGSLADALEYWCELRPLREDGEEPAVACERQIVVSPGGCTRPDSGLAGCRFTGLAPGSLFEARLVAVADGEAVGAPCCVPARTLAAGREAGGHCGPPPPARRPPPVRPSSLETLSVGPTSAALAWRGDPDEGVEHRVRLYRCAPGRASLPLRQEVVRGCTCELSGLEPDTAYNVEVSPLDDTLRPAEVATVAFRTVSGALMLPVATGDRGAECLEATEGTAPLQWKAAAFGSTVAVAPSWPRTASPAPLAEPTSHGRRRGGAEGMLRPRQPKPVWQQGGIMGGLAESAGSFGGGVDAVAVSVTERVDAVAVSATDGVDAVAVSATDGAERVEPPGAACGLDAVAVSATERVCHRAFARAVSQGSCESGLEITGFDSVSGGGPASGACSPRGGGAA